MINPVTFPDGPLFTNADIVGRHQPPDGIFGIAQELHGDRSFLWSQHRKKLASHCGGKFFEDEGNYMMTDALEAARQLEKQGKDTRVNRSTGGGNQ